MAAASPKFSIVIPSYNYGRFVHRAIDSALAQTGDDFEVVVVDDGSKDDTPSVVARYGDRIRSYRHANCGAAATRNRGAELAAGEYLLFLDADDRLLPTALTHFRAALAQRPDARMVFGHHVSIAEDGSRHEARPQPTLRSNLEDFRDYLDRKFGISHGTVLMRRDNFTTVHYPVGISNGEDIVLFAQSLALFPCVTIPHATAEICAHDQRMRNNLQRIRESGLHVVDAMFRADLLPPEMMAYRTLFLARRHLSLARSFYRGKCYREAREHFRAAFRARWTLALNPTHSVRYLKTVMRKAA